MKSNPIDAVFFDYDGVLTRDKTGSLTTYRYLSTRSGIPYRELAAAFAPHNDALNSGKTTHAKIWPAICRHLGQALSIDLLVPAFESTPVNEAMFALADRLRPRYAVGIITDNKKDRFDCLKRSQRLEELFSPIVVSAEVGCTKDSPAIFERALMLAGVRASASVFIDNTPQNLVAAAASGMRTVHFDDERSDMPELVRRLRDELGIRAGDESDGNAPHASLGS